MPANEENGGLQKSRFLSLKCKGMINLIRIKTGKFFSLILYVFHTIFMGITMYFQFKWRMVNMESKTFKRKELYELVWPNFAQTSKEFNITDVVIRKICIRMNIPLPRG